MIEPGVALMLFGLIVLSMVAVFWPRRGMAARLRRVFGMTERARMEDALKHLQNVEYTGRKGSIDSISGALQMPRSRAARLMAKAEALRFVRSGEGEIDLTDDGRSYALRVLRTHRLWERYLADRTGVRPSDWHEDAEYWEHRLSASATEDLAARMGHPRFDPHGDPIPTAAGELPPKRGASLNTMVPGQTVTITHIEDEPRDVFDEIVEQGLSPQMRLQVIEVEPHGIRFIAEGREHVLEPIVAANITVELLSDAVFDVRAPETLARLVPGESAEVVSISPACQGPQRRRLLDLGVVPGTVIRAEMASAMLDPMAYDIRGALVALRRRQAEWIQISRGDTEEAA